MKRSGNMVEAVEHLPSKCEAMSSNPSTASPKIYPTKDRILKEKK
jgi:hypothetical protein